MARRSRDVPQEPGYLPSQPSESRVVHRLAENGEMVAYTAEEYGVRKDDGHGLVKPVNSSGGLLFLAILASLFAGGVAYGLARIAIDGTWEILADIWWIHPGGNPRPARRMDELRQRAQGRETAQSPQPPPAG